MRTPALPYTAAPLRCPDCGSAFSEHRCARWDRESHRVRVSIRTVQGLVASALAKEEGR